MTAGCERSRCSQSQSGIILHYIVPSYNLRSPPRPIRTRLLSLFLLIPGAAALAQPTLTGAANTPQTGDVYTYYRGGAITPGPAGASQTWDFSTISSTSTETFSYIACSAAPNCAGNPGTTTVGSGGGNFIYLIQNATTQSWKGLGAGPTQIQYSDPEEVLHFPMTYNNTFTDNFTATFNSGVTFTRTGTVAIMADGWGTLKLPNGTFNNVLRVKRTINYTDVSPGLPTYTYNTVSYTWLTPSKREFLLNSAKLTINGTQSSDVSTYTNQTPGPTAIGDPIAAINLVRVSPNPASGNVVLTSAYDVVLTTVSLTDLTGKTVLSISGADLSGRTVTLATAGLPRGMYMLRLLAGDGQAEVQKIVLQ